MLPKIEFIKGSGGLARQSAGLDHVSCLYFIGSGPTAWDNDLVLQVKNLAHAEELGIIKDSLTYGVHHYHISEFFRLAPGAKLHVAFATDETEIEDVQRTVGGEIRQFAVDLSGVEFNITEISGLQTIAKTLEALKMPTYIVTTFNFSSTALASLPVIIPEAKQCPNVSVMIGCDNSNYGLEVEATALGTLLGAIAKASVHESIAWVQKFNVADPMGELQSASFPNGDTLSETSNTVLEELETKRYIFFRKHVGSAGTYFNNSHTCTDDTSDYAYIENERTIDKALRNIYAKLLPSLNAPIYVDPVTGKLTQDMVSFFEDLANQGLEQMERDRELSGYKVFVDPEQNILSTGELEFVVQNVPVGVVRQMKVKISYTTSV